MALLRWAGKCQEIQGKVFNQMIYVLSDAALAATKGGA